MAIIPNAARTHHLVVSYPARQEHPEGFHRLVGGSVELGETHSVAIAREVEEELGAALQDTTLIGVVESIFTDAGELGHEVVFVHVGRLDPEPAEGARLVEADGTVLSVTWRPFDDVTVPQPVYPAAVVPWLRPPTAALDLLPDGPSAA